MNIDTYKEIYPSLLGYALSLSKNKSDAEDLVSDTILQCVKSETEPENIKYWCLTVLKNKFISSKRKKTEQLIEDDDPYYNKLISAEDTTSLIQLQDCFEMLSQQMKQIVSMSVMRGIKAEEISQIIDKPIGTVLTWMSKGKKQLAECIGGQ